MGIRRLALLLALALGVSVPAEAAEPAKTHKVKVGILELTSSAPVFVGDASLLDEVLRALSR
jgi:ABC-type nitrate/sulfonate/bicarbonate transport system substrate-binding protein